MKYRRPERPNPQYIYKGFLVVNKSGRIYVYDITGKPFGDFNSHEESIDAINAFINKKWRCGSKAKNTEFSRANPPETMIYDEAVEIVARKGQGHKCDAACKRANHTYRHKFTHKHGVYGSADGKRIIIF